MLKKIQVWFENLPEWLQVSLILSVVLLVRFYPFLLGQTLIFGDNFSLMVPGKIFSATWLKQGVLPLWNPLLLGGISWIGDVNQSLLYPSTLLFMWFSPAVALNLNLIFHLGLTFVGTYVLTKKLGLNFWGRVIAATIWSLSPQLVGALNNISIIQSLSWVPWVVWAGILINRGAKSWFRFALLVTIQFLAGYPPHLIYTIGLAVILSFEKKNWTWWFINWTLTAILTLGLSAFIWLPFLETLFNSTRMIQSAEQIAAGSLHPAELIKFIMPYFFEKPRAGYRWGPSWNGLPNPGVYLSWLGLVVGGLSLKKIDKKGCFYLSIILLTLLWAMIGNIPGSPLRGPSTVLLITTLVGAIWVGWQVSQIKISSKTFNFISVLGIIFLSFSLISFGLVKFAWPEVAQILANVIDRIDFLNAAKAQVLFTNFSLHLLIHFLLFVLTWWALKYSKILLVIFIALEMTFFTQGQLFFGSNQLYQTEENLFSEYLTDPQSRTITRNFNQAYTDFGAYWDGLSIRQPFLDSYIDGQELADFNHLNRMKLGLTPDWNLASNVPVIHGYTTLLPQDMDETFNSTHQAAINALPPIELTHPSLSDWAVKYYLVDTWFPYPTGVETQEALAKKDHWELYELPALPRFRFADDQPVNFINFSQNPNLIEFEFENDNQPFIIMADRYDKNWQAWINDQPVEVENYQGMRRLPIAPGNNQLTLRYLPSNFYFGLIIAGISLIFLIVFFNKKISVLLFSLITYLLIAQPIQAQELPQVLLINQVRGTECCEAGTVQTFQNQLDLLTTLKLPAVFTFRWDALVDEKFIKLINQTEDDLFTWGIFLEITPQLAEAAGVNYEGSPDTWYQAQHAYTLGYSEEERRQLVDTLMKQYYQAFNHYPEITTSWIIDTPTLNYLHDEYGVLVHQITREQWGTDSYTLYGGLPHYPYPASRHWAFMPDFSIDNSPLIVRQTLIDPVWNYGDTQSRFTSQPNDFSQDGKDIAYFEKIFDQALFNQPADQLGFALLGLENSMDAKYQDLFQQQLEVVAEYYKQGKISLPDLEKLRQTWFAQQLRIYQGQDFINDSSFEATWIVSPNYRLRFIRHNDQLCLDDIRLYSSQLEDFYSQNQAQDLSYWIAPFLLDGSRYFVQPAKFMQKKQASAGDEPLPDSVTQPECWQMPPLIDEKTQLKLTKSGSDNLELTYQGQDEVEHSLIFKLNSFRLPMAQENLRLQWLLEDRVAYQLHQRCDEISCWYEPQLDPTVFSQAQTQQRAAFLPEKRLGQLSAQQSQLYAHNVYAIAGRNPVRVVFSPRDEYGVPVKLEIPLQITSQSQLETDATQVLNDDPQFYDFSATEPMKDAVHFRVDQQMELITEIYFAPNCKQDIGYCLSHPQQTWWYVRSLIDDKLRLLQEKIYKWKTY